MNDARILRTMAFVALVLVACAEGGAPPDSRGTAPSIIAVRIEPLTIRAGDRLTCAWDGFVDAEFDEDRSRVEWFRGGSPVGTGKTWWGELRHGDVVRCTVTPSDGENDGTPLSAEAVVANSPPTLGYVNVMPLESAESAGFSCLTGGAHDADGEPVTVDLVWTVDGFEAGRGPTLAGSFRAGQKIACEATPHDGTDHGPPITASLTAGNRPPSIGSVWITPSVPRRGEPLRCEAGALSDPDGDPVSARYVWKRDGNTIGSGPEFFGDFARGVEVGCFAIPNDGKDDGPAAMASVTFGNTPPIVTSVSIFPDVVDAWSNWLRCDVETHDAEGDPVVLSYSWTRNGVPVGVEREYLGELVRGDEFRCMAIAHDETDSGEPTSGTLVVSNAQPFISQVRLTPVLPVPTDTLTCDFDVEDPDGDEVTLRIRWLVNDVEVPATGKTLAGSFNYPDHIRCEVTATDGVDTDSVLSSVARVRRPPPVLEAVEILPSPAYPDTPLTCSPIGMSDPGGAPVTLVFTWYVNGIWVTFERGETLSAGYAAGDTVRCTAIPRNDTTAGQARETSAVIASRDE